MRGQVACGAGLERSCPDIFILKFPWGIPVGSLMSMCGAQGRGPTQRQDIWSHRQADGLSDDRTSSEDGVGGPKGPGAEAGSLPAPGTTLNSSKGEGGGSPEGGQAERAEISPKVGARRSQERKSQEGRSVSCAATRSRMGAERRQRKGSWGVTAQPWQRGERAPQGRARESWTRSQQVTEGRRVGEARLNAEGMN